MNINSSTPLISIIIPNYNHSSYLNERIDSVLSQTYDNFELLILDDCSTDNSREVIESYRNRPHVKAIIFNETNSGSTFRQWEKGFSLANGEYIWIAESDDVADKDFLAKAVSTLIKTPNSVLAFSRSLLIDQNSNPLPGSWDRPMWYHSNGIYPGDRFCRERLLLHNTLYNASMIVFRRSAIDNVDDIYQNFRLSGDWYFWFQICRQGVVIEIPEILNKYRLHANKVSVTAEKEGLVLKENLRCQCLIMQQIKVPWYILFFWKGCLRKNFTELDKEDFVLLQKQFPTLTDWNWIYSILYKLDKVFHFSKVSY